jgi:hypothetical protein
MERFLVAVIEDRMRVAGITPADLSRHPEFTRSEATLSRVLAGRIKSPNGGWDDFVGDVGAALDESPLALWADALELWRADPKGITLRRRLRGD